MAFISTTIPSTARTGDTWFDGKHHYVFNGKYWMPLNTTKTSPVHQVVLNRNDKTYYFHNRLQISYINSDEVWTKFIWKLHPSQSNVSKVMYLEIQQLHPDAKLIMKVE